jgi:hypothetical protein
MRRITLVDTDLHRVAHIALEDVSVQRPRRAVELLFGPEKDVLGLVELTVAEEVFAERDTFRDVPFVAPAHLQHGLG